MGPRQPQSAKPHCPFEGDRAILIEKVIDVKFYFLVRKTTKSTNTIK